MAVKSPAKIRRKVWSMVQKVPVLPMPALHKESAEDSQETPKKEGGTKENFVVLENHMTLRPSLQVINLVVTRRILYEVCLERENQTCSEQQMVLLVVEWNTKLLQAPGLHEWREVWSSQANPSTRNAPL
jgi:hypothetical protein